MAKKTSAKASAVELLEALDELQNEKGITKDYMVESLKLALEAAYKKNYETGEEVRWKKQNIKRSSTQLVKNLEN